MKSEPVYVGIDVCKSRLDVHVLPCGEVWSFGHDQAGLEDLMRRIAAVRGAPNGSTVTAGASLPAVWSIFGPTPTAW